MCFSLLLVNPCIIWIQVVFQFCVKSIGVKYIEDCGKASLFGEVDICPACRCLTAMDFCANKALDLTPIPRADRADPLS